MDIPVTLFRIIFFLLIILTPFVHSVSSKMSFWSRLFSEYGRFSQSWIRITPSFQSPDGSNVKRSLMPSVFGISSSFGLYSKTNLTACLHILPLSGCKPLPSPNLKELKVNTSILLMLRRGGCPFDLKVYHAQMAGYDAVIISQNESMDMQSLIRMTSSSKTSFPITIPSFFISFLDGNYLEQLYTNVHRTLLIRRTQANSPVLGGGLGREPKLLQLQLYCAHIDDYLMRKQAYLIFLAHILYFITLVIVSISALSIAAGLQIFLSQYFPNWVNPVILQGWAQDDLGMMPTRHRLTSIQFQSFVRVLQDSPTSESRTTELTCAICFENLLNERQVCLLPCGHIFHAECCEIWLIQYMAICPLCKDDVGKKVELREKLQEQIRNHRRQKHWIRRIGRWLKMKIAAT